MWTIIKTSEPSGALHARFPQAGHHNSENYFFVGTDPDAVDPIRINPTLPEDPNESYDYNELFLRELFVELMKADRGRHIQITKRQASMLHRHPAWRLWRGDYLDIETGQVDQGVQQGLWQEAKKMYPSLPAYTPPQAQDAIKLALKNVMK